MSQPTSKVERHNLGTFVFEPGTEVGDYRTFHVIARSEIHARKILTGYLRAEWERTEEEFRTPEHPSLTDTFDFKVHKLPGPIYGVVHVE